MTAINLFAQRNSAYMLNVGAMCDFDGALVGIENKVLALPVQRLAICMTGFGVADLNADHPHGVSTGRMIAALAAAGVTGESTQADILHRLPYALRAMHVENSEAFSDRSDVEERSSIMIAVAAWDPIDRTAKAYLASTEGLGPHPAYTVARVREYITAPSDDILPDDILGHAFRRQVDLSDPHSFDVRKDGLALLDTQRSIKGGPCSSDAHTVGGRAYLTEVSEMGATVRELHVWAKDVVGQRIQPKVTLS